VGPLREQSAEEGTSKLRGRNRPKLEDGKRSTRTHSLHNSYTQASSNIIRAIKSGRIRWVGHVARTGKKLHAYRILVDKPEYKRATLRSRNSIQEEIKSRLKSGNACYHSVQNVLSSGLLPKNTKIRVYRTIILPVVLYGCETWSLTLREEESLRVFENRVLRRIFGPKRDKATGEWRRLHNEELNDLYSSPSIIRVIKSRIMRWAGHVAHKGEGRCGYMILVERPEERRPIGRPRRRWKDNIKMYLQQVEWGMDWIELAQDRDRWRAVVNAVMNLRVP
jgi:hypothetical protein